MRFSIFISIIACIASYRKKKKEFYRKTKFQKNVLQKNKVLKKRKINSKKNGTIFKKRKSKVLQKSNIACMYIILLINYSCSEF